MPISIEFISYNFHIFRFSRSGKGEVDVYRFMSKHSSDHSVLCCHDPLSHLAIDAPSYMKLMLQGQILHDLTLVYEIKVNVSPRTGR